MLSSFLANVPSRILRHRALGGRFQRLCSNERVSAPVIGIDLGTTNSCVAVMEGSDARVIANAEGQRTTPSVVAFTDSNEILVGEASKRQAISNSKNTVYGTKRLIGRRYLDKEVQDEAKHLPFKLVEADNGDCWVEVRSKKYSPSQIGGFVLSKMRDTASAYLGMDVKNAVVTVPAYFNDSQRQATKDAGAIAGLNVARIINEPTAAALAYGLSKKSHNKTVVVFDLGGGTFDVSVLDINDGVFEVRSTNGDTRLGGEDFDNLIIKNLIDEINSKLKTDVRQDMKALQRIKEAAEKAKIELSFSFESEINLPYLIGANSFQTILKRANLENMVDSLIQKTVPPCKQALADAKLTADKIDEVILVGGMTRMPKVTQVVKDFFKKDPCKGVNPDEAVAMGAAIQGGVLVGSVSDIVLVDVTPLSLGVKTRNDVFSSIIPKNTPIPTRKHETYTTNEDNQTSVLVSVYQGERQMCSDNLHLGEFVLGPIPPRPRGTAHIQVTFELDCNGIVKVTAVDTTSNIEAKATIQSNPRGLSKDELEKMAKEAEKEREKDQLKKSIALAKNEADTLLYSCKEFVGQNPVNAPADALDEFRLKVLKFESNIVNSTSLSEQEIRMSTTEMAKELAAMYDRFKETSKPKETPEAGADETQPKSS